MYALINGEIYTGEGIVKNKAIIIDGNRVEALVDEIPKDIQVIDLQGKIIAPAFIDLQLNGCGGVLFNDEISLDTLRIMNETNIKTGTTSYLPTLITTTDENIEKALKLVEETDNLEEMGVLGLHIEGPYISIPKKGIHNPDYIRVMSDEIIHKIAKFGSRVTKIMTIAPENAKVEHLKELKDSGINLSIGHTNATYEEALEKVEYFKMATHLFNAMSSFTSREPGVIGAIFENKSLYTGIIVDGVHSHYGSVKIAKDILKEKLFLVTDAVAPVGTNMESFMFEGNKVLYKDGKCISPNGTLGGSALTMIEGVQNLVKHVRVSLEEALLMASTYPAKAVKVDNKYGYIKEGYIADLVVLDKELNISNMIVKGEYK